jgi:polyhydroxybutyrate depolymerase
MTSASSAASPANTPSPKGCELNSGRTTLTITSGGIERTVLVHVPAGVEGRGNLPTVLNLHSSAGQALWQLEISQLGQLADTKGFVVVAPQGIIPTGDGFRWNVPHVSGPDGPDDEQFLTDVMQALVHSGCTDPKRIYGTGYSGGARMISQYACDNPGRLAAIAPVAGLRAGAPRADETGGIHPDPATCSPDRGTPVVTFAGTADTVNPHDGGGHPYWGYGTAEALERWAELNGCHLGPWTVKVTEHVSRTAYSACHKGARAVMYVIEGDGHTWPGSTIPWPPSMGTSTQEISANKIMWRFFTPYRAARPFDKPARDEASPVSELAARP